MLGAIPAAPDERQRRTSYRRFSGPRDASSKVCASAIGDG